MGHSKRYVELKKLVDPKKVYAPLEAIELAKKTASTKFEGSVEVHLNLGIDIKKSDQVVRATIVMPNSIGSVKKVAAFVPADKEKDARDAGAELVGAEDLIEEIQKTGKVDFDVAVATPDMMKDVGKLGMVLGRRGLMPNPKTGTVTNDLAAALNELRKGRTEFRSDKTNIVHIAIGKASMEAAKIAENLTVLLDEINRKRPSDAKGDFVTSVYLACTMGPSVRVTTVKNEKR